VLTASDGAEALIFVAENRKDLRAVIVDLHMPHMDGLAFVRAVKRMLPEAGIVVASGNLGHAADQLNGLGVNVMLDKPFTQETLIRALEKVLRERPPELCAGDPA
jgi:CheY-like chemotaxis protein